MFLHNYIHCLSKRQETFISFRLLFSCIATIHYYICIHIINIFIHIIVCAKLGPLKYFTIIWIIWLLQELLYRYECNWCLKLATVPWLVEVWGQIMFYSLWQILYVKSHILDWSICNKATCLWLEAVLNLNCLESENVEVFFHSPSLI